VISVGVQVKRLLSAFLVALAVAGAAAPALAKKAPPSRATQARPASPAVPGKPYIAPASFAEALDRVSKAPDFVGLAVAVVRDGKVEMVKTYGVRMAGTTEPVTPDTVFRLASLSKAFGATLAAMDVRAGKLAWTDKVVASSPSFKLKNGLEGEVTVEDVLSHRVGLPPFAYDDLLEHGTTPAEILAKYADVKPACAPHACFNYENTTYNMIQPILEKVAGQPYAQLVRSRIFDPLGMRTASVGWKSFTSSTNWASPHRRKGDVWVPVPVKEPYYRVPAAGGVNASIMDMTHWLAAQMGSNPQALPPEIVADLTTMRVATPMEGKRLRSLGWPARDTGYGLGWRSANYSGTRVVYHSGSVEGFLGWVAYVPDRHVGIVVLSNTSGTRTRRIVPTWLDYELALPKTDRLGLDALDALAEGEDEDAGALPEGQ
jgi:beta-lactamase class C